MFLKQAQNKLIDISLLMGNKYNHFNYVIVILHILFSKLALSLTKYIFMLLEIKYRHVVDKDIA